MSILSKEVKHTWSEELSKFQTLSLYDLEPDNLMDRKDRKFLIPEKRLQELLTELEEDYLILEVEGKLLSKYQTLYLDTADFRFYTRHHNGSGNRYKLRFRHYADTDVTFFEVKSKNNRKRTLKNRIYCDEIKFPLPLKIREFISEMTSFPPDIFEPKLWVNYNRITLINKKQDERVTIDSAICLKSDKENGDFGELVIVEVKQASYFQSSILNALRKMRVQPASMSKYCMAVSKIIPGIRKNNFKPNLLYIQKIVHDA